MIKRLLHIGVAVKNLDESSGLFSKLFGIDPEGAEEIDDRKVRVVFFAVGNASLELTEATSSESPIAKFIEKRGEGVHHLSFEVDDIRAELARLKRAGFRLIDESPHIGAGGCLVAFLHPKSTNGVLVEISQTKR